MITSAIEWEDRTPRRRIHVTIDPGLLGLHHTMECVVDNVVGRLALTDVNEKRWRRYGIVTGNTVRTPEEIAVVVAELSHEVLSWSDNFEVGGLRAL